MKNYSTLMFDAFDTLIHIDRERLPEVRIAARGYRTTAPALHRVYRGQGGSAGIERFFEAFRASFAEANRRRGADHREIPSADRFRIMLDLLAEDGGGAEIGGSAGIAGSAEGAGSFEPDLPGRLARIHMETLQPALLIRPENRNLLEWALERGYRLALVSNFDYSPAVHACLERHGVAKMFEAVIVSDAVGWRKPHPYIFERTLEALAIAPADALFVGDRLDLDVDGAAGAGIDAVWVDTGAAVWSEAHAAPMHTIRSLAELRGVLES